MTKAELLADLAARPFIDEVGVPENKQPVIPEGEPGAGQRILNWDGSALYHAPVRQLTGEIQGGLGLVPFYVVHEGESDEFAYYKDEPPRQRARPSALREWMMDQIGAAPNSFRGFSVIWISETWEMVVYAILDGSPLIAKYFYVRKGAGAPVQITGTAAEIANYLSALRGSLLVI